MGKSSKDKRDAYYRLAKEQGWRARSAFKLLQLDEEFNLFEGVTRVVDLCAAPGSWSQVLSRVLIRGERFGREAWVARRERLVATAEAEEEQEEEEEGEGGLGRGGEMRGKEEEVKLKPREGVRIVAVDLQPMAPLPGIVMLRADITHPTTIPRILEALDPPGASSAVAPEMSDVVTATAGGNSGYTRELAFPGAEAISKPSQPPSQSNTAPQTATASSTTPTSSPPPPTSAKPNLPSTTSTQPPPPTSQTPKVDLILSDGAPDVTGLHDLDTYIQSQLLYAALSLSLRILKPNGTFVAKIFRGKDVDLLYAQLRLVFASVVVAKPRSSRASSVEAFVVCRGFMPPEEEEEGLQGGLDEPMVVVREGVGRVVPRTKPSRRTREDGIVELELGSDSEGEVEDEGEAGVRARDGVGAGAIFGASNDTTTTTTTTPPSRRWIPPFLACGDLSSYDADATYRLPVGHVSLDPVQPPTAPPYRRALEVRRERGGGGGKVGKR